MRKNDANRNGLPTALLYLGLFALAGCCGLALFLLAMAVFLWLWLHVCDWTGIAKGLPSDTGRVWLGALVYLVIAVPLCVVWWKKQDRSQGRKDKGKG